MAVEDGTNWPSMQNKPTRKSYTGREHRKKCCLQSSHFEQCVYLSQHLLEMEKIKQDFRWL